ncbi:hypothetical protein ONE63_010373 [Megalurothrips usitatus]|uniref:Uncharacterized protein n=1 Tax=Megalurothrips usitatus TaxID=439358 RepID=A0AAV7XLS0_9NEOP|nr:hypothetical protein ONE63_010373 [Megalurothrips usitatus]
MYSGGMTEVYRLRPDVIHIYLKRKGFCRVALSEGAQLVPAIMLGENLSFPHPFAGIQKWIYRRYGVSLKLPFGICMVMPLRQPQMFVVGAPLEVKRIPNPTRQQINDLHMKFVESIRQLYVEFGPQYSNIQLPLKLET